MSAAHPASRLFSPFFDSVDMIMCCPATTSLAAINEQAERQGLRFPLVCAPRLSLREHLTAIDYAPASARFGPYVDNVLGMNWELPSGHVVRIGERVIKSTTGYDLLRFLLHSDGRYGHARDYVLRLRPLGGKRVRAIFQGDPLALESVRIALLRSPWIHWLDTVDLHVSSPAVEAIEIEVDCLDGEQLAFGELFAELRHGARVTLISDERLRRDELPVLSMKTTLPEAPALARRLVSELGGAARVLCVNGVVHYFPASGCRPIRLIDELGAQCTSEGGHLTGAWAGVAPSREAEIPWAATLETTWKQL